RIIASAAAGVGVARQIEPLAAPALTVGFRRQKPLDYSLIGIGGFIVEEGLHFGWRRRQSGQVVRDAPNQGSFIGVSDWVEMLLVQLRQNETVNIVADPCGIYGRNGRALRRLKRPELTVFGGNLFPRFRLGFLGPWQSILNPTLNHRDLFRLQ